MWAQVSFILSKSMRLTDRQTDRQKGRRNTMHSFSFGRMVKTILSVTIHCLLTAAKKPQLSLCFAEQQMLVNNIKWQFSVREINDTGANLLNIFENVRVTKLFDTVTWYWIYQTPYAGKQTQW